MNFTADTPLTNLSYFGIIVSPYEHPEISSMIELASFSRHTLSMQSSSKSSISILKSCKNCDGNQSPSSVY